MKAQPYSRQDNWSNDWLTPIGLVRALGPFDLDPCCARRMPHRTARRMIAPPKDGLEEEWKGRVWMNPPYRRNLAWCQRLAEHGDGVALLNGRSPETRATQLLMGAASAVMFPSRRLEFLTPDGRGGDRWFPSILIAVGRRNAKALKELAGHPEFGGKVFFP